MKKRAIFPGTFDPFTIGHDSLVKRSLKLTDELIIGIGINDSKQNHFRIEERLEMIQTLYKNDNRVIVKIYDSLTVDFAQEVQASFIIRGVRSVNDFEYEKSIADMNRKISGIETIVLFTEPELTHVSSTIVRELLRYGHDISNFIPQGMVIKERS